MSLQKHTTLYLKYIFTLPPTTVFIANKPLFPQNKKGIFPSMTGQQQEKKYQKVGGGSYYVHLEGVHLLSLDLGAETTFSLHIAF